MPPKQLTQWESLLQKNLPELTVPQVSVLAMFSFAVASTGMCGLTTTATYLGLLLDHPWERLRQRLREFYKPASAKAGAKSGRKRRELDVSRCFAGLLGWIVRLSKSTTLAIAIDATTLSDRFTILSISVVYRSTAIPVAWSIVHGNTPGAWKPHWVRMFALLKEAVPPDVLVLVCADRGLYAKWMFKAICDCGWHPMLRVNNQGYFCDSQGRSYECFAQVLDRINQEVSLSGVAFKEHRLPCTLLAYQSPVHKDPWLILTDLPPEQARVQWYGMRGWIEQGFKSIKSGTFQWQRTRISDPARAERLWLVLAVATLLVLMLATRQEDSELQQSESQESTPNTTGPTRRQDRVRSDPGTANGSRRRRLRLPRLGQLALLVLLFSQRALGTLYLDPEPWADHPPWIDLKDLDPLISVKPP